MILYSYIHLFNNAVLEHVLTAIFNSSDFLSLTHYVKKYV